MREPLVPLDVREAWASNMTPPVSNCFSSVLENGHPGPQRFMLGWGSKEAVK
jgi:hypothetical protein